MKTLDQIEARTAITNTSSLVIITQPGSYYLTHNLTVSTGDGIDINTNNVTLDLNGFTIASTAASASGTGILLTNGLKNITIANGFIQGGVTNNGSGVYNGSGFGYGIYFSGVQPANVLVSRVSVAGCLYYGIYLLYGNSTVVESCTVQTAGSYGIVASTIKQSTARDIGDTAIYGDQVADCRGESAGLYGTGLYAYNALNCYGFGGGIGLDIFGTAQNCYGSSSSSYGLYAYTALNCYGSSSSFIGIFVFTALNCYGNSSSSIGLYANNALNCYGESSSGTGLYSQNAAFCIGYRSGGTAIQATVANGCYAAAGTNIITYKYNMP